MADPGCGDLFRGGMGARLALALFAQALESRSPPPDLFPTVAIGYFGNNILPARAGELLRAVVLKKDEQIPISASLATIIVERVFDGVVMLGFVFVNLPELARLTSTLGFCRRYPHPGACRDGALPGRAAGLPCWLPCSRSAA